jgi:predicted glycoside hydrolase/deacetylase ChbG (UPF0249 family)
VTARLIVTADDAGLDPGMTAGIIEAHRHGIVTACSVVANGVDFDDTAARLRDVPSLEIGVHLTLVEERALTTGEAMPSSYIRFLLAKRRDPEGELRAQIDRVLDAGFHVTHLNGHQHLHLLPRIFAIVEQLARDYRISYIRRVDDHGGRGGPFRRLAIGALNSYGRAASGTNECTIGVMDAGHLTAERILALFGHVHGTTELVTHPGINVTRYSHWRYDWDEETRALCDPRLREALDALDIELIAPSDAPRRFGAFDTYNPPPP